ncbi:type IV pilus biogenesis protein EbsA [Gloeobacter violaceus]|uniref:Gll1240 protein n=1 Tax=Gloeobacter violaceus (strain ATCC 29082 / PCC 7421) TaxID=251221 RepID=Q7NL86_GLOVI|nr:type IV pilus biogenesis protein EbsA [Gloeobacter violaceus]BAC89181.1 gll1240 [Gloeobacter violaceus PCC 7421]
MESPETRSIAPIELAVYLPYMQAARRPALPGALSLFKRGGLEGVRQIEGAAAMPWSARWDVRSLPVDPTQCRLDFREGACSFKREMVLPTFELVGFLAESLAAGGSPGDFSAGFYRRLFGA